MAEGEEIGDERSEGAGGKRGQEKEMHVYENIKNEDKNQERNKTHEVQ